jgi:fumarate reductase subunit C
VTDPVPQGDATAEIRLDPHGAAGRDGASAPAGRPVRAYPFHQPANWWLRRRGYVLYMVREVTVVPVAVWMVLLLVEIARLRQGAGGYQPLGGPVFVAFSVLCLAAVLWHAYTFLSLAGMIMRIPRGDGDVPPRVVSRALFGLLVVVTAVIAALLVWGGA